MTSDNDPTLLDNERPTDPHELKPSLPPNSVTFADILGTHQAILSEVAGLRGDVTQLVTVDVPEIKKALHDIADAILELTQVKGELIELKRTCRERHENGKRHMEIL